MVVWLPVLVGLIGLLMYALSTNGKVQEIGRIMFFCGCFVWLLQQTPHSVTLFH
jgi:hypothetical protein